MKVGDLVMFVDKGSYKKWFFGKIGTITRVTDSGCCRVRWTRPVKYFDMKVTESDFEIHSLQLMRSTGS